MSENQYRAVKYIRLSHTTEKEVESDSVINQRRLLDSFIESQPDINAVSEKVDDGFSGILFDRPAFKEMMDDIKAGRINCVIVKDLSRFGREYIETGRYLRRVFPAYGVRFIAVNDNIDTIKDSSDDLMVSLKNIINDAYCHDISVKTRSALSTKRINGEYVGACTVYGYKKAEDNHNRLIIDEYPAGVVRDIFRLKLEGMSAVKIAESLNDTGVLSPIEYKRNLGLPHPTGGFADKADAKWSATTIIRILKDEIYTGTLIQGRKGTFSYKLKDIIDKPKDEWVRIEGAHERIIDKRDFELVQRILKLDTRTTPNGDKVHLFSGVLICGCCGSRMTRKTDRKNGRVYHYYYCPTGKKNGCNAKNNLKESDLISHVLEVVKSHVANAIPIETFIKEAGSEIVSSRLVRQCEAQIAEIEHQFKENANFKATLYENLITGIISKEDYKKLKEEYTENGIRLQRAVKKLKQELDDLRHNKSERLFRFERFKEFEELETLDRRAVVHFIQSIKVVSKTELQITFNYQFENEKTRESETGVA